MNLRNELTILQKAVQKAIDQGFLAGEPLPVVGVDISFDPPTIIIRRESPYGDDDRNLYFDPLFPLWESAWAIAFWGRELTGNSFFGAMSAWKYHQHKLLEFLQNHENEEFYRYIEAFL
jgi:hypothetical protein